MKLAKKIRSRWRQWQFKRQKPEVAARRNSLKQAIMQGRKAND